MPKNPIDPATLKALSNQIKKEGKENGLTDNELGKRKNKHWNDIYTFLVLSIKIFIIFQCCSVSIYTT